MHRILQGIEDMDEWFIDADQLRWMKGNGLEKISTIQKKKPRTQFEEQLLAALQLYGKSCISNEMGDKLLYIVTALESLLVKDSNEGLIQNVSDRLAFVIAEEGSERQKVITNYKETYALRSRFVHHGQNVDDQEKVAEFMRNARQLFFAAIARSNEFATKDEFVRAIEKVKYGGGTF